MKLNYPAKLTYVEEFTQSAVYDNFVCFTGKYLYLLLSFDVSLASVNIYPKRFRMNVYVMFLCTLSKPVAQFMICSFGCR